MADGTIKINFTAQGVDDIMKKLEDLEKKAKALQQTVGKVNLGQTVAGNQTKFDQLQKSIDRLRAGMAALQQTTANNNTGMSQLGGQMAAVASATQQATAAINRATQSMNQLGQQTTKVGQAAGKASITIHDDFLAAFTFDKALDALTSIVSKLEEIGKKALEVSDRVQKVNRQASVIMGQSGAAKLADWRAANSKDLGASTAQLADIQQIFMGAGVKDVGRIEQLTRTSLIYAQRSGKTVEEVSDKLKALYADAMDLGTIKEDLGVSDTTLAALGIKENAVLEDPAMRDKLLDAIAGRERGLGVNAQSYGLTFDEMTNKIMADIDNLLAEVGSLVRHDLAENFENIKAIFEELTDSPQLISALKEVIDDVIQTIIDLASKIKGEDIASAIHNTVAVFKTLVNAAKTLVNSFMSVSHLFVSGIATLLDKIDQRVGGVMSKGLESMGLGDLGSAASYNAKLGLDYAKAAEQADRAMKQAYRDIGANPKAIAQKKPTETQKYTAEESRPEQRKRIIDPNADKAKAKTAEEQQKLSQELDRKLIEQETLKEQRKLSATLENLNTNLKSGKLSASQYNTQMTAAVRKGADLQETAIMEKYAGLMEKAKTDDNKARVQMAMENEIAMLREETEKKINKLKEEGVKLEKEASQKRLDDEKKLQDMRKKWEDKLAGKQGRAAETELQDLLEQRRTGQGQGLKFESDLYAARQAVLQSREAKIRSEYAEGLNSNDSIIRSNAEKAMNLDLKQMRREFDKETAQQDKDFSEFAKTDEFRQLTAETKRQTAEAQRFTTALESATASLSRLSQINPSQMSSPQQQLQVTAPQQSGPSYSNVTINGTPSAGNTVSTEQIKSAAKQVLSDYERRNSWNQI